MPRNSSTTPRIKGGKSQSIAFGLVNVPIRIKNVDAPASRSGKISANFICGEHQSKARQVYVCDEAGQTHAAGEEIEKVKGYPVEGGFVQLEEDVLEEIVAEKTGAINIDSFVPEDQIDPLFYRSHYIVEPDEGGGPTYDLLAKVLADTATVGIGTAVLPATKKTQLVAVRWSPFAEQIMIEVVKFDTEINWDDLDLVSNGAKARPAPTAENVKLATQIVTGLKDDFDPEAVEDVYMTALRDAIAAKAAGQQLKAPTAKTAPALKANDLAAQLKKSVEATKKAQKKPAAKTTKTAGRKKAAA